MAAPFRMGSAVTKTQGYSGAQKRGYTKALMMTQTVHEHLRAVAGGLGHDEWAALPDHGERLRQLVACVPPAVWHKVSGAVTTRYHSLEERYGRPTAIAILSAGIVGSAVPLPGATVLAMAPLIALAELHHRLGAAPGPGGAPWGEKIRIAELEILHLSLRTWFSVRRYWMTSCCCRLTQPARITNGSCQG